MLKSRDKDRNPLFPYLKFWRTPQRRSVTNKFVSPISRAQGPRKRNHFKWVFNNWCSNRNSASFLLVGTSVRSKRPRNSQLTTNCFSSCHQASPTRWSLRSSVSSRWSKHFKRTSMAIRSLSTRRTLSPTHHNYCWTRWRETLTGTSLTKINSHPSWSLSRSTRQLSRQSKCLGYKRRYFKSTWFLCQSRKIWSLIWISCAFSKSLSTWFKTLSNSVKLIVQSKS
jgi:hypothetical protein